MNEGFYVIVPTEKLGRYFQCLYDREALISSVELDQKEFAEDFLQNKIWRSYAIAETAMATEELAEFLNDVDLPGLMLVEGLNLGRMMESCRGIYAVSIHGDSMYTITEIILK